MAWNIGPQGDEPWTNFSILGNGTTVTHLYWWDDKPLGNQTQMAFASPPTIATPTAGVETVSNGFQMRQGDLLKYTVRIRCIGFSGGGYRLAVSLSKQEVV